MVYGYGNPVETANAESHVKLLNF